jgi:hypothetical protein
MMPRALPRPFELLLRVLATAVLVLGIVHVAQRTIIQAWLPVICAGTRLAAADFTIRTAEILDDDSGQRLRIDANLAMPIEFEGQTVNPFGWSAESPAGGYRISLSLPGLLQYSSLLLIIAIAWSWRDFWEITVRLLLCVPLMAALLMIEAPLTITAELWQLVGEQVDPLAGSAWTVSSRFLMGGGGLLLAGLGAALAIGLGARLAHRRRNRDGIPAVAAPHHSVPESCGCHMFTRSLRARASRARGCAPYIDSRDRTS